MKNRYSIIVIILLSFLNIVANAQISDDELGEFTHKEDYLKDLEDELRQLDTQCCGEIPDLTFFYTPYSAQTNHDAIMEAKIRAHRAWFNRQYEGFKKEIEKQLKKTYPNFEQAQNEFYKHVEKKNVTRNHGEVEKKYKAKVKAREVLKDASLRNLKLFELRRKELIIGNLNNTNYGSFNYNGTPIGDIKSMSQLNTLKEQEISTFGANEWKLQDDNDVWSFLYNLDAASGMLSSENAKNYDYRILNELSQLQLNHFNTYGSWEQLDLMQLYLNDVRMPLVMVQQIWAGDYGTAQFIENYVVRLRSGGESIFDPKYFDYLFDMHSEDYYAEAYAATGGAGLSEEELEEITENIIREIEEIVTDEREEYINDLLGDISEDDFDDQIIIDKEFEGNPCLNSIYKDMGKSAKFKEYLQNFEPEFSVAHLRLKYDENFKDNRDPKDWNALAITEPPLNGVNNSNVANYNINITFNGDSNLEASIHDKPKLIIAVAFIHEMIHAEVFRKMLSAAKLGHLNTNQYTTKNRVNFIISLRNNFEGIFDYYVERWKPNWGHEQMAQHYINTIINALKEYDNNEHTQAEYEAIAWLGLEGTIAWNNLTQLERENITQTRTNFIDNDTDKCN